MPADRCQFLYQCSNGKVVLQPLSGDCCVFRSYGSVQCPSKQEENDIWPGIFNGGAVSSWLVPK